MKIQLTFQITYLTGEPSWRCHRTPTYNLKCNIVGFNWHTTKIVEPGLPTTSVCPEEDGNVGVAAQCVRVIKPLYSYLDAVKACETHLGFVAPPIDTIQSTILG